MRSSYCGAVALAAVGLLALAPLSASAQRAESGLLGNKLWNRHSDVLRKHGQPTRIEIGAVVGGAQQPAAGGAIMGGMAGSGGPGMPGMPRMAGGMPGGSGSPYGGGGSPGGGSPYGSGGFGAQMGQIMAQRYGGGGSPGGGLPGMGGMPGMEGSGSPYGPGSAPGGPAGSMMPSGGATSTATEDGEITWVYERGPLTNLFLFNKDGRLIQVSSFGYSGGGAVTSRGIRLGDPLGKVYAAYGWTGKIAKDPQRNTMTLDFSKDHHVAFQVAQRGKGYRVVGITVGITELGQLLSMAGPGDFSGARPAGGTMGFGSPGGMPGMPGGGTMRPGGIGGKLGGGGGSAAGAME